MKLFQGFVRVHASVHVDEGATPRRNQVDRLDDAILSEEIREVLVSDQF